MLLLSTAASGCAMSVSPGDWDGSGYVYTCVFCVPRAQFIVLFEDFYMCHVGNRILFLIHKCLKSCLAHGRYLNK